jgi:hypothetical protein
MLNATVANETYLTPEQAAAYLRSRVHQGTRRLLAKWRSTGGGPRFHRVGSRIVYRPADLDAWIASRVSGPLTSTSDRGEVA